MKHEFRGAAFLFLAAVSGFAPSLLEAQDTLTLGRVTSAPGVVRVPVYLRVVDGTAFNSAAGNALQGISFRVNFSPSSRVSSVRVDRTASGGLLSGLTPIFESSPRTDGSISYVGLFEERIPAALGTSAPGQKLLDLTFTVAQGGGPNVVKLAFDGEASTLSNQGGTVTENAARRSLALAAGAIEIRDLPERRVGPRVTRPPRNR